MCEACNKEILVDQGRLVNNCMRHGNIWCSCKVRQFLNIIGLHELDDDDEEVRFITEWFPKNGIEYASQDYL